MITIDDNDVLLTIRFRELAEETINRCLDYLNCEYECDVSIMIVGNEEIREINKEYRKINKATDVLSFPMVDWKFPCDYSYLESHYVLLKNPETENILLGDIVLSMDKVISQAVEYNHSREREFSFLLVHSMLHLFGYDHMEAEEERIMINKQKEIMNLINYK